MIVRAKAQAWRHWAIETNFQLQRSRKMLRILHRLIGSAKRGAFDGLIQAAVERKLMVRKLDKLLRKMQWMEVSKAFRKLSSFSHKMSSQQETDHFRNTHIMFLVKKKYHTLYRGGWALWVDGHKYQARIAHHKQKAVAGS